MELDYQPTTRKIAFVPDIRLERRETILASLAEDPITMEQAMGIWDELAAIEKSLQTDPPEGLEVGSVEWFAAIREIEVPKGA